MKSLYAMMERESNETLDDIRDQLQDKVEYVELEFGQESFSKSIEVFPHDDDITSVNDHGNYDSHGDDIIFLNDDDSFDSLDNSGVP